MVFSYAISSPMLVRVSCDTLVPIGYRQFGLLLISAAIGSPVLYYLIHLIIYPYRYLFLQHLTFSRCAYYLLF